MKRFFCKLYSIRLVILLFAIAGLQSCNTKKHISAANDVDKIEPLSEVENINVKKVFDGLVKANYPYKSIVANKVSININKDGDEMSFQSSIRILRDSAAEISVRKFSIPAGKVFFTTDSVYYINNLMREYIASDYELVRAIIDFDFNYCIVQAILSDLMCDPNIEDVDKLHKIFSAYSIDDKYVLTSLKDRKIRKIEEKGQFQKLDAYLRKYDTESMIYRRYEFDKESRRLKSVSYRDLLNNRNLAIEYSNFKEFDNSKELFPRQIDINYGDDKHSINVSVRINKINLDVNYSTDIRIPSNYKKRF
ncbi:MAG: DUF4292 domain-containing protein [Bacteroidales bacterium]